jgi:hypothetical protein
MSSSVTQEGGAEAEVAQQVQQQTGPKPIYAFWGGNAGSSKPPAATKAQPRKRKKADDGSVQQTLLGQGGSLASQTTASGSSSKTAESQKAAPRKKGKSRAGLAGGEEAELEEMSKRAKQADGKGASKEKRGKKGESQTWVARLVLTVRSGTGENRLLARAVNWRKCYISQYPTQLAYQSPQLPGRSIQLCKVVARDRPVDE